MLITKQALGVANACSKDETRPALNGVLFQSQTLIAANGHILAVMPNRPECDNDDFPKVSITPGEPKEPIIILRTDCEAMRKAIPKSNLPALRHVAIDGANANGAVACVTTDLQTEKRFNCRTIEGPYPNVAKVIPTDNPNFSICFSVETLETLLKTVKACSVNHEPAILFEFHGDTGAAIFRTKQTDGLVGCVMPYRASDPYSSFPKELLAQRTVPERGDNK